MIAALFAWAASAGVVFSEDVPLSDVEMRTEAAVIVRLGAPAMQKVEIPVPGSPETDCGTYSYGVWRVTVEDVVGEPARGPALSVGQVINVFPADTPALIDLSRSACVDGMSRSVMFPNYAGQSPDDGEKLIVLLRWVPPYGWVEAVAGAWLLPNKARSLKKAELGSFLLGDPDPNASVLCVEDADCGAGTCHDMACRVEP